MKTCIKNPFIGSVLIAGLGLMMLAGPVTSQTFTILHNFPYILGETNLEGSELNGLIVSGSTLFGTANSGGPSGDGTVFKINTDGSGFANLHYFASGNTNSFGIWTNSDGVGPNGLVLLGDTLYGTARGGGNLGNGTVFTFHTDGTGFSILHSFAGGNDGTGPAALVLSSNVLYGTAGDGGFWGNGMVFAVDTDGRSFTTLHSFTPLSNGGSGTNSDGAFPNGLVLSRNTLYGTTSRGGISGNGTFFALHTDGTGFTNVLSFGGGSGLTVMGDTLYWITSGFSCFPGEFGDYCEDFGGLFALNTDGTGFTNILMVYRQRPGYFSFNGLLVSGDTLYGTSGGGGPSPFGFYSFDDLFAFNANGTGLRYLYHFPNGNSRRVLALSGNTLYGIAETFPNYVFSLSFPPQLTITPSASNIILSWPTNYAGFDYTGYTLQSTTNLASTSVWSTNSPVPIVLNGMNTVTNPISSTQQFFRLSQ